MHSKRRAGESGVALILTLSAVLILTTVIVEFAYNTHVAYEMAANERDRLKAVYLARSGLNFIRLELVTEKRLRSQYASLLQDAQGIGITADPFCKQFPFSTGLVKGIASGALTGLPTAEEGEEEAPAPEEAPDEAAAEGPAGDEEGFFSFNGDFEVTCDTEESKINLNVFRSGAATTPPPEGGGPTPATANFYEEQKNLLYALLIQKSFEPYFKGPDEVRKVVNQIADWADPDDRINEAPGVAGGSEESEYPGSSYKVKNGKYGSIAEILLLPGIGDDVYRLLAPQVTVFGDNKINLCQAPDDLLRAFLLKVSQAAGATPLRPEDEETLTAAVEVVRTACDVPSPQPGQVAAAIAGVIGGVGSGIASQITTSNRFYSVHSTGTVEESSVTLRAIIDTQNTNPNLWKTLYYRVE